MVIGLLPDDIRRQGALSQQGIGRDVLATNVAIREQRDRHADLIGSLGFVTPSYGQATDFF
jgi:hypothetical protein